MIKISKYLSRILRHSPGEIGIKLDQEGWTDLDGLIRACRQHGFKISRTEIEEIVEDGTDKKRFEICNGKIRATHGHTIDVVPGWPEVPPETLYHATATRNLDGIFQSGLLPGKRQFVHLTESADEALAVASRHGGNSILLRISAVEMQTDGYEFYRRQGGVWLVRNVPAKMITVMTR